MERTLALSHSLVNNRVFRFITNLATYASLMTKEDFTTINTTTHVVAVFMLEVFRPVSFGDIWTNLNCSHLNLRISVIVLIQTTCHFPSIFFRFPGAVPMKLNRREEIVSIEKCPQFYRKPDFRQTQWGLLHNPPLF
jgi:hypothetical protein